MRCRVRPGWWAGLWRGLPAGLRAGLRAGPQSCLWLAVAALSAGPALAHGDVHQQIHELSQRIRAQPQDAALLLRRAELHRLHRQFEPAAADLQRALAMGAAPTPWRLATARLALDRGEAAAALQVLNGHLQDSARDVALDSAALALRACAHERLQQHRPAMLDHAARVQALSASGAGADVDAYLAWAEAAERAQDSSTALAAIAAGEQRLGPLRVLQLWAIEHLVRQGQWAPALQRLDEVIQASPRQEQWQLRRAEILQSAGDAPAAAAAADAALLAWQRLPAHLQGSAAMQQLRQRIEATRANLAR